jgi:hypothetical protein
LVCEAGGHAAQILAGLLIERFLLGFLVLDILIVVCHDGYLMRVMYVFCSSQMKLEMSMNDEQEKEEQEQDCQS